MTAENEPQRYEIAISIADNAYIDTLVYSLVRQGYDTYYNADENVVCFTCYKEDVTALK